MILAAKKLNKRYGAREILTDCTFDLPAGACMLLRGPSGGGKSTLLRILALLEQADGGQVMHGERRCDVATPLPNASPYPFLTVVFQQLFLWPNLTMAQNISMVLDHQPHARLSVETLAMLERLSIARLVNRLPHECSLGERQRVALARALLSPAQFLLLDEPSSALDRVNRETLVAEIAAAKARNRGVFVVTHDDLTFDSIADQAFELENGRLRRR